MAWTSKLVHAGKTPIKLSAKERVIPRAHAVNIVGQPKWISRDSIFHFPCVHHVCDKNLSNRSVGLEEANTCARFSMLRTDGLYSQSQPPRFNVLRKETPRIRSGRNRLLCVRMSVVTSWLEELEELEMTASAPVLLLSGPAIPEGIWLLWARCSMRPASEEQLLKTSSGSMRQQNEIPTRVVSMLGLHSSVTMRNCTTCCCLGQNACDADGRYMFRYVHI